MSSTNQPINSSPLCRVGSNIEYCFAKGCWARISLLAGWQAYSSPKSCEGTTIALEPILLNRCRFVLYSWRGDVGENVSVYIEDGRIAWIGADSPPLGAKSGFVVDCDKHVLMPCLYNAHTHAAMVLLRGYHDDSELMDWLGHMWAVEWNLDPHIVYLASKLAVLEMVAGGTCGFMDMYFYPEETVKAAKEVGVRVALGPVIMGDVDPYKAVEISLEFAKRFWRDDTVKPVFNVHSIYATPHDAIKLAAEKSLELGVPLHIHVSETRREVYEAKKRYGVFPVELLDRKLKALHSRTVLVHAGWIASWELELVKRARASIVHCPTSNMKLATAGHFPAYEAIEMGINVGLGTDGAASNNSLDMFLEMKMMVMLQRHSYWDTRIKAVHALKAATIGSAHAMGLEDVGEVRVGYKADLVLLDIVSPRIQPLRQDNLVSTIVYAATGDSVAYTIVDGKPVYTPENREEMFEEAVRIARELNSFIEKLGGEKIQVPPCSPQQACKMPTMSVKGGSVIAKPG